MTQEGKSEGREHWPNTFTSRTYSQEWMVESGWSQKSEDKQPWKGVGAGRLEEMLLEI